MRLYGNYLDIDEVRLALHAVADHHTHGEAWIAPISIICTAYRKIKGQTLYSAGDQQKVIIYLVQQQIFLKN